MSQIILLKMGELVLKGLNRSTFERRLLDNAARRLKPFGDFCITARQSTAYIAAKDDGADIYGAYDACTRLFGVAALTLAYEAPKDLAAIIDTAACRLAPALSRAKSFKVEAKRADKHFALSSPQIQQEVGGALHDRFGHLSADMRHPEVTVVVEVREQAAYIHTAAQPGAGGLPNGLGGRAVLLLSGGIDSPVAGFLCAKRGLSLLPVHFYSYPYTGPEAKEKVVTLSRELAAWCGPMTLRFIPFTAVQEAIRRHCPDNLSTLILRRMMMRAAHMVAHAQNAQALITGESLGQVASQTLEALAVTDEASALPVLRPVIGLDKEEIVAYARRIGTFETSILPYEDCCTVFTPRHPKTKPHLAQLHAAEQNLSVEALLTHALAHIELVKIN